MTHDELLEKIGARFEEDNHHLLKDALRAVVELHKPDTYGGDTSCCTARCQYYEVGHFGGEWHLYAYPCPTIQAIEEQLG